MNWGNREGTREKEKKRGDFKHKTNNVVTPAREKALLQPTFVLAVGNRFFSLRQNLFKLVEKNGSMNLT